MLEIDSVLERIDTAHTHMDAGRMDLAVLHLPIACRVCGLERGLAYMDPEATRPALDSLEGDLREACDRLFDLLWDALSELRGFREAS